ncbi:hypothetical protein [Cellulomonas denverensis]|uniref:hypothetical protein n=1 Tax=Cellulomonas denverensis TaxID=264297 RepID=UPI0035E5E4DF
MEVSRDSDPPAAHPRPAPGGRARLTRELVALDPTLAAELTRDDRDAVEGVGERIALIARRMVHAGSTHAEVAEALDLPTSAITPLIAPRRRAA